MLEKKIYKGYFMSTDMKEKDTCTYDNYEIFKKPKELADDEIALILGNLMFGYSKDTENLYSIYND